MLRFRCRLLLAVFLPVLALLLATPTHAWPTSGHATASTPIAQRSVAPSAAQVTLAQTLDQRLYLPLLARAPLASIEFASEVDPETGVPIAPTASFNAGLDLLWVSVRLEGYAGRSMRLDFTYADDETLVGRTRTVEGDDYRFTTAYCITTAFSCERGRLVLPVGQYTARVFIDGVQVQEAVATIR